jgi:hypothetical protein
MAENNSEATSRPAAVGTLEVPEPLVAENQTQAAPRQAASETKVVVRPEPKAAANYSIWYSLRHHFGDVLRYLYLMRFSLVLWLSMIVLAWADAFTGAASFTRGILTPFAGASFGNWQWFFAGFAVVLPGWFALLAARIVCAYGEERFETAPPPCFHVFNKMEWFVFWGAQVPGAVILYRIGYNSVHEREASYGVVIGWLAFGGVAALIFWYLVSVLYYWVWNPDSTIPVRAFLVPRWRALPLEEIENLPCGKSLRLFSNFVNVLCKLGRGYEMQGRTGPGHIVATIAFVCAVILYLLLMPVSAPVPVPNLAALARLFSLLLTLYVVYDLLIPACRGVRRSSASFRARWLPVLASFVIFLLGVIGTLQPHAPRVMPVIAYVVILLMVIFWTMAGIAFFVDRFRIPVLTSVVVIILGLNHWPAEHVFPAEPLQETYKKAPLLDPTDYVRRIAFHNNDKDDDPVIIVTATGGGIHAAAWTAAALDAIDHEFGSLNFHHRILLMSSVSGGSVASAAFLREYFTNDAFTEATYNRVRGAAACSSLQAVAWGLAYPDTFRLLFPWVFDLFPAFDRFDRGWAMQKAFDRNLRDRECVPDDASRNAGGPGLANLTLNALTVGDPTTPPCLEHEDACKYLPAFTLNTTVVETGDRFLLSNYSVFAEKKVTDEVLPAASFLGTYAREAILPRSVSQDVPHRGGFADLSLLTAARLSATFTYISPAARLPFEDAQGTMQNAYHFVDGGYYDNDGTNSAIEFLKAASEQSDPSKKTFSSSRPLRVLLIEIRNSDDLDMSDSPDSYANQARLKWDDQRKNWYPDQANNKRRFGPVNQALAPPEAAVAAGFSSTTRRNRRELDTLEDALCGSLELKHIVLDYQQAIRQDPATKEVIKAESEVAQPLSWHLTQREQNWINGAGELESALDRKKPVSDREKIREGVVWFQQALAKKGAEIDGSLACKAHS